MPYPKLQTWSTAESKLEAGGTWLPHTCQWNGRNNVGPPRCLCSILFYDKHSFGTLKLHLKLELHIYSPKASL